MQQYFHLADDSEYVEHILNLHDGEARFWGEPGWTPFPAGDIVKPRFWHYQFAKNKDVRYWLHTRSTSNHAAHDLSESDITWIMREEQYETMLLRLVDDNSASGERCWFIRTGNYITLAELFRFGCKECSCFELYRIYIWLSIIIHKRQRGTSTTPQAIRRSNAKQLHYNQTGRSGLPENQRHWY